MERNNLFPIVIDQLLFYKTGSYASFLRIFDKAINYLNLNYDKERLVIARRTTLRRLRDFGFLEIVEEGRGLTWNVMERCLVKVEENSYLVFGETFFINEVLSLSRGSKGRRDLYISNDISLYIYLHSVVLHDEDLSKLKEKLEFSVYGDGFSRLISIIPSLKDVVSDMTEVLEVSSFFDVEDKQKLCLKTYSWIDCRQALNECGIYKYKPRYGYSSIVVVEEQGGDLRALGIREYNWGVFIGLYLTASRINCSYFISDKVFTMPDKLFSHVPDLLKRSLLFLNEAWPIRKNGLLHFENIEQVDINYISKEIPILKVELHGKLDYKFR